VLKLILMNGKYGWEFVAEDGKTFSDAGYGICH